MGHLYNEPILTETDPSGRLTAYEWRGSRYLVHSVLKSYAMVFRVRVSGDQGGAMAVAELVREGDNWRLRHYFNA